MQTALPSRLSELPAYLLHVLLNPAFNPQVAFLVYASIALLLLLILAVGVAILIGPGGGETGSEEAEADGDEEFERLAPGETYEGSETGLASRGADAELVVHRPAPARPAPGPRARGVVAGIVVVVLAAVWMATGVTTSDREVCTGCHWPSASHAKATAGSDRHSAVACVACHEPGGVVSRYTANVPARLTHFVRSQSSRAARSEYGQVTASACSSCHRGALRGVVTDRTRSLKISHEEPLQAGATCIDCHALRDGVVGTHNVGMNPCLRCHDAKVASARCETCHDRKAASAARARTTSFADAQIEEVSCGGCHDEKKECDTCHGLRLPHTGEFKAYAHARAGAADFWYNGGKGCARCHNASRRSCQRCHGKLLGKGHGTWLGKGHQTAGAESCDGCHRQYAYLGTRDFCKDLCHTPGAIAGSSR